MLNSAQDPLDFDDLSAIYRVEKKAPTLSVVRKDLYPAMASLLMTLKAEYDRHLSIDPESLICEGANQRKKRANQLSKEVVELRMSKICSLALRGAMGAQNTLDALTQEEREYYSEILDISRRQEGILDRLSGKRKPAKVDIEAPVKKLQIPKEKPAEQEDIRIVEDVPPEIIDDDPEPYIPEEEFDEPDIFIPPEEEPEHAVKKDTDKDDIVVIRILEDLPTFSGPEQDYTLFKEDIVRMPTMMADALIGRDKAVKITPTP